MKCSLVFLAVASFAFLASADDDEHHTTPPSTTACHYPEAVRVALAECVREHASDDLKTKLTEVNHAVSCDTDACTLKKFCESPEGLVTSSAQHYSEAERAQFRTLHVQCATAAAAAATGAEHAHH